MALYKVINHESYKVHWARGRREDLAKVLPEGMLNADEWWHWKTLCGVELIGRKTDDYDVSCSRCIAAYERGKKQVEELAARFG